MLKNRDNVTVGLVSLTATSDKEKNLEKALSMVEDACARGAEWICLPEMFAFHGPYDALWPNAEFEDGPLNQTLASLAKKNKVVIFAGSLGERPPQSTSGKVYNTQYVFGRDGSLVAKYRKTHLFNLLSETGAPLYCESEGYLAGDKAVSFQLDGWHVGLATCYDLRFPEYFASLSRDSKLDCILIPSAFTLQTGMYHWSVLLRARAIENLCYVLAANQVGQHSPGKVSYGHASVVDPWGTIRADSGHQEQVIVATIQREFIKSSRSQLPALNNRRPEIYK
jgi:predicted amidohydrolase